MKSLVLTLALTALTPAQYAGREPHPLAPSLPLLTDKEQEALERVVSRLTEAETGKLKSQEAARAVADFNALGPEAVFALLDGLNEAANLEHSCPAVLIANRLARLLGASEDRKLLDFARGHVGAGVTAKRHTVVLKDLKLLCQLRLAELQRRDLAAKKAGPAPKPPSAMTLGELVSAAGNERGPGLRAALVELEKRQGAQVIEALGTAAGSHEGDDKKLARELLVKHLARQPAASVEARLRDKQAEVRLAAVKAAAAMKSPLIGSIIDRVDDPEEEVRQAARQALVRIAGRDFGPEPGATAGDIAVALSRWHDWWEREKGK